MTKVKLDRKLTKLEMEAYIKTNLGRKDLFTEDGVTPSVPAIILPCDPIALVERLDVLIY